jgi:hypothetical protein
MDIISRPPNGIPTTAKVLGLYFMASVNMSSHLYSNIGYQIAQLSIEHLHRHFTHSTMLNNSKFFEPMHPSFGLQTLSQLTQATFFPPSIDTIPQGIPSDFNNRLNNLLSSLIKQRKEISR